MDIRQAEQYFRTCAPGALTSPDDARAAFAALGVPESPKKAPAGVRFVGVAGTAGKTAVASMEAAILAKAGFTCGLYRAGHAPLAERITVNGAAVTAAELAAAAQKLSALAVQPTRAAAELAVACACFSAAGCDFAVVELSDTLLAQFLPEMPVCAITQIGADGTGHSPERAARIAASVLRRGCVAVTTPSQPKAALQELIVAAGKAECELIVPEAEDVTARKARRLENHMDYGGYEATLPLVGRHSAENAAVAVEVALALWRKGFEISDEAILAGMPQVLAAGGPVLLRRRPYLLADPCHNPLQAAALARLLREAEFEHVAVIAGLSACEAPEAFFAALETGFIPEGEKDEKNQMPGMSENAVDKLYLFTPEGEEALAAEAALEAARFHFDAQRCESFAACWDKAAADGAEGIIVLGGDAACRAARHHVAKKR